MGKADKNNSDPILSVQLPGRRPILLVETKLGDAPLDPSLRYLCACFPRTDAWQVTLEGEDDFVTPEGIRVAPAAALLQTLV